jgi:hypothetical protein
MPLIKLLGLDPSMASTGWAVGSPDGARPAWGSFPRLSGEPRDQLKGFIAQLNDLHDRYSFEVCYFEFDQVIDLPGLRKTNVSEGNRFMLRAAIDIVGLQRGFETVPVRCDDWRKTFIGVSRKPEWVEGRARDVLKELAVDECARIGWIVSNDDEAEALGVMVHGLCKSSKEYANLMLTPLLRRRRSA